MQDEETMMMGDNMSHSGQQPKPEMNTQHHVYSLCKLSKEEIKND